MYLVGRSVGGWNYWGVVGSCGCGWVCVGGSGGVVRRSRLMK